MVKSKRNNKKRQIKPKHNKNMVGGVIFLFIIIALASMFFVSRSFSEVEDMNPVVIFETSKGNIKLELDRENAPITTENFVKYVEDGHFDGLIFHRVIPNFMIQGGGFLPDGTQRETRAPIKLESDNGLKNVRGTVAMARTMVPDSATSQFFINLNNNEFLNYGFRDEGYAVFGRVVDGMSVVDEIAKIQTANKAGHGDWPLEDVLIIKAYLE